jgi:hypothetical protein
MIRAATALLAASLAVAAASPAQATNWWFWTGVAVGATLAPAYGYPFGYRAGYASAPATAPWGPPQQCHWTKVWHHGAWLHDRVCSDAAPAHVVRAPAPLVSK